MNARPATGDAGPYYFTYINHVEGTDCLAAMTAQREPALAFFRGISEAKSTHRYAPDKWSIRQVLNHVNDTERLFTFRALWFARTLPDPLPSFEQEIAAAGAEADRLSWAALVDEFDHVRRASIDFFRNLDDPAWTRRGIASGNSFTVLSLGFMVPGHVTHHMGILRERYL
ncbi:MAG TPA: DinB family protein [Acidobacteriaceae bacterium]